jgi:D-alanyl-lipoteichoic acid acyltransferase DltB (MBOAT superfamily)
MLFSNPDYPIFLIAVFFLYALSRLGGARGLWARVALMLLLGDLVFLLVAKDPDMLWDPLGGVLYRLATAGGHHAMWDSWPLQLFVQWAVGLGVLGAAITLGRRGGWIITPRGQQWIARGMMVAIVTLAAAVGLSAWRGGLDELTAQLSSHGHLLVLFVLGIGIGAAQEDNLRPLGRVIVLFVASSLFYHAWAAAMPGPYRYLLGLLLFTIVLDYFLGIWIENTEDPLARKALLIVSVVSNLGILFFFKYADFVTHDVLMLDVDRLNLILPAGISFHTFQSLSYTIDVYRKKLPATRSVVQFATFVLFFPQLVAGPIVRAQELLPQLDKLPALEMQKATRGLFLILVGLFKKIALADTLAIAIVDRVFEAPENFSSIEVLTGVYGYALQIYLDFSAYSDIAIGSALVLGMTLPENFRTPYRSANLSEFWRRWHISLSTWLRDYLYIALGGNRGAQWRTYLNLILTMLLGGLWHGASWAFIVWGGLHGFGLAITRYFQRATEHDRAAAGRVYTTCLVVALVGFGVQRTLIPDDTGTWTQLMFAWLYLTPLWAVLTAWLGRDPVASEVQRPPQPWRALDRNAWIPEALRLAMCASALLFLGALQAWEEWTWIPLAVVTWGVAIAADIVERGGKHLEQRAIAVARRAAAVFLVFNYVCLAWIFFRAESFDQALGVLRRLGAREFDHANLVPLLTTALAVGFLCHFFADGTFRWLRERFVSLPAWGQGIVLAAAALVLRELGHAKVVPFIYFQF